MSGRKIQTEGMRDAFRYSPGDGHTYTWDGASATATVYRHSYRTAGTGPIILTDTGDTVSMDGVARTATAFMDTVDRWRAGRVTGVGS